MRRIVLTFGLIGGAMLSLMMLMTVPLMKSGEFLEKGMLIGYTTMVLAFLMVFFGIKSYRDNVGGGQVRFGRAFGVGMLIVLITTVCYVITWQVVYAKFVPDFGEKYAAHIIEKERAAGATEARLAQLSTEMADFQEMYEDPLVRSAFTFIEPLPVGLLFALVSAAVLSRRRREERLMARA
jgi:hypothetical protein